MTNSKNAVLTPRVMSDLLSARLHALANLSAASTTLRVERKFGLTLLEWRAIGQLGGFAPLSLKELARRAGLDKSYASRTVSSLTERGLVASERSDTDGRGVLLSLTEKGQELYEEAFNDAIARNDKLLASLRSEQRVQLIEMLGALTLSARRALEDERKAAAGEPFEDIVPVRAAPARRRGSGGASDGVTDENSVDLVEIRYLVFRLNELVGGR